MTSRQIALVRSSWQRVLPIKRQAAALFYQRLFDLDPGLAPLFRGNITRGRQADGHARDGGLAARSPRRDAAGGRALGRRHAEYGVEAQHYDTVGAALLGTLRTGLGDALSPDAEEAWAAAYTALADVMKQAAVTMAVAS